MNKRNYISRSLFWAQLHVAFIALFLTALFIGTGHPLTGLLCITLCGVLLNKPKPRLCTVTISVPEILKDIMSAFRTEVPELGLFTQDFSSNTAVLGDSITSKISHVPLTGNYDVNLGWKPAAQTAQSLIEDVPVVLSQLTCVTVKIGFITGLASKVDLYKAAIASMAYALGKRVVDIVLNSCLTNVSNTLTILPFSATVDSFDGPLRNQCNFQKMAPQSRWAIINTPLAASLGNDDRVRSELFWGQRNNSEGLRVFTDLGGFKTVREYPDLFPGVGAIGGIAGDHRLAVVAVRKLQDMNNIVEQLGIPKVMEWFPIRDESSGLELTGVAWQESGTSDLYLSIGLLWGCGTGSQGGAAGTMTDNAGLLLRVSP